MASHSGITWGKVIAGATIAAGAVVLASAIFPSASPEGTLDEIGKNIKAFVNWVASGFKSEPGQPAFFEKPLGKGLIGAAAIGGGFTLLSHMNDKQEDLQQQEQLNAAIGGQQESFAVREQMRAMQSLMQARMAATSPQYAGAAGRGA